MKKIILLMSVLAWSLTVNGQPVVVTIGTGTSSQYSPFDFFGGYARSAALYTAPEIGASGVVTHLGWEVVAADIETCPIRIYLKLTSVGFLSAATWSSITGSATLVYDGIASFPSTGWKTIDISDFVYVNTSGDNLMVLCEANYGGNGAMGYPFFTFSYAPSKHEEWQQYELPPPGNGTPNENRPNIQLTMEALTTPHPPSGLMARGSGTTQVTLEWKKNADGNPVMVAYNTENTFGNPVGSYVAGNAIAGGGTVIYNGGNESFVQNSGLSQGITYYYKAWSVLPPAPAYSIGTTSSAPTLCNVVNAFPYLCDFSSPVFPPVCWSIARKPWVHDPTVSAFSMGSGAVFADFFNTAAGSTFDLILPVVDITGLSAPVLSFDHAYASYSGENDQLQMWVSGDGGTHWALHYTWDGGAGGPLNTGGTSSIFFVPTETQWSSQSLPVPAGTNRILLRGMSAWGNALYLDNIQIGDQQFVWNGSVSGGWGNAINWTPNTVPGSGNNVVIPSGKPFYPVISASGASCRDLLLQPGASMTVNSGCSMTFTGNLTIQTGALFTNNGTIQIQGNLVNQNP